MRKLLSCGVQQSKVVEKPAGGDSERKQDEIEATGQLVGQQLHLLQRTLFLTEKSQGSPSEL